MRTNTMICGSILMMVAGCGGGGSSSSSAVPAASSGGTPAPGNVALKAGFSGNSTPSIATASTRTQALAAVNTLRREAGLPASIDIIEQPLSNACSLNHAGFQTWRNNDLSHFESTTDSATGPADTGNSVYSAIGLRGRAQFVNDGADIPGTYSYYEVISSIGGVPSIRFLWNTVYHRVPFMRQEVRAGGFGDRAAAVAMYPISFAAGPYDYATLNLTAVAKTQTLSYWPMNGGTGIERQFSTDSESPDPLSGSNPYQIPRTQDQDICGPPLHLIFPTSKNWRSLSVSMTGPGSTNVPVFVLAGSDGGTALPTGADTVDRFLDPGEVFVLPKSKLAASTLYTVSIGGSTTATPAEVLSPVVWSFTTTNGP